jgi:hypothetical protein
MWGSIQYGHRKKKLNTLLSLQNELAAIVIWKSPLNFQGMMIIF